MLGPEPGEPSGATGSSRTSAGTRFIAGEPMNAATKMFARLRVELLGRADLLQDAEVHDGDAVAHRHRLDLIVRDVDRRRPEAVLELQDLRARLHAQLRVEVRQRLVHEERRRLAHDRASERDALALAAGELLRLALEQRVEIEDLGRSPHAPVDLLLRHLLVARGRTRGCRTPSCAGRARRTGTPSRCRGAAARRC